MPVELVRAEYEALEYVARKFDTEYERIRQVQERLAQRVGGLRNGGWDADAARAFYSTMDNDVLPAVAKLAHAMEAGAYTSREIIRVLKDAEEEAAAQLRYYDELSSKNLTLPSGGGGKIVNNDVTSSVEDPTIVPKGVEFIGIEPDPLEGLPDEIPGAQYEVIENMSQIDKSAANNALDDETTEIIEGLNNNDDLNSCGPLTIAAIANLLGINVAAGKVFSDFVVQNADTEGFDPVNLTTLTHLIPLANSLGMQTNLVLDGGYVVQEVPFVDPETQQTRTERSIMIEAEDFTNLLQEQLENGNPLAALVNIDQYGVVVNDTEGTNHWVAITGVSEEKGTNYIRIWNSMHNRQEYYEVNFFMESFVSGQNTVVSFEMAEDAEI